MKRSAITRYDGVSKKSIIHRSRLGGRESIILTSGKQNEREAAVQQKRRAAIQPYDDDRQAIAEMDIFMHGSADDVAAVANKMPSLGMEDIEISHEGGEYEVFEDLAKDITLATGYQRVDSRTRKDRTEIQTGHWLVQMDKLVSAYLKYQTSQDYDGIVNQTPLTEPATPSSVITIEVVDLFFRKKVSLPIAQGEIFPNETLLRNGYLGCSPLSPTVAITVRSLLAYRQTHRTCPRFSIDGFSKSLCHLHNEPFHNYLQKQLTMAFDIYLELCRQVNKKLNKHLGYDTPRTRLIQQCPPCFFSLQEEPDLDFSVMISMDGNNSLKRIGATIRERDELSDSRSIDSDRWLTAEEVDRFKNEVNDRPEKGVMTPNLNNYYSDEAAISEVKCAERWKNAGPEQRKQMFTLFEETGVFIAACRHRTILYACDMIKSGELFAKYPLAIVNRLIDEVGDKIGCAYDIGCAFHKTLSNSSLGPRARDSNFRLMVGAFHGYAHERSCQLAWHPLYIKGTGRTEGEGCEHIFSSSNDLARNTRYASRFHRHQAIDDHFRFWDQDKYALLSTFIVNHYKQAVQVIKELEDDLANNMKELDCSGADFEQHFATEQEYLSNLEKPDPVVERKREYVKALRQLVRFREQWENTRHATMNVCHHLAATGINDENEISRAKCQAELSYGQVQNAEALVILYETMLGVSERWTAESAEYKQYYKENVETSYRKAVDELERAVVMRIWELTKMKASGTVKKAIKRYNDQAELLEPPALRITWEEIAEYTFVGEFDLLRITRSDIRQEKWTWKAYREAAIKYFKLCHAREEVERLNVEIRRLQAFVYEETRHTESVIEKLNATEPLLADELRRRWSLRSSVNVLHLQRLKQLRSEPYYTGSQELEEANDLGSFHLGAGGVISHSLEQQDQTEAENEQEKEFEVVADFVASIVD